MRETKENIMEGDHVQYRGDGLKVKIDEILTMYNVIGSIWECEFGKPDPN
jgi:hypothetical protein